MGWFKVDDKLHDHPKTRKAGKAAMGVWVLSGSWSRDNGTDGFIPAGVLTRWGTKSDAARLVAAGLWFADEFDGEAGWRFHDWDRFQPGAAVTAAMRAKESEAGIRGNHRRWHAERGITDPTCEYCHPVPDEPPEEIIGSPDGVPDGVPDANPNRGANRVSIAPLPLPLPDTQPATQVARSDGEIEPAGNAGTLVAEWLEHTTPRPPSRVIGHVSREIKILLEDAQPYEDVRRGLAAWAAKGANPASLASFVHEVRTRMQAPRRTNSGVDWDAVMKDAQERERSAS